MLVDAAHNPAGMRATLDAVQESFDFAKLIGVVAVSEDKDVEGMLDLLEPLMDEIVVTRNSSPRSMDVDDLAALAEEIFGMDRVHQVERMDGAIDRAIGLVDALESSAGPGC